MRGLLELSRVEASAALVDGLKLLVAGHDPLRDQEIGQRYWLAVYQWVAPIVSDRARKDFGIYFDVGEAVELITDRLELQVLTDVRRVKEQRAPLLPQIIEAKDPLSRVIYCATKVPDPSAANVPARYPGWVYVDVFAGRNLSKLRSLDELVEGGMELPGDPDPVSDEDGWSELAAHALLLVLPETPVELRTAVSAMVEWSVAALPRVSRSHEREKEFQEYNRVLMAVDLFSDSLSEAQIVAVHNLVWGPAVNGGHLSSLFVHVAEVRLAHKAGSHPGDEVPLRCERCLMTPLNNDRLRALAATYAENMARSLRATAA